MDTTLATVIVTSGLAGSIITAIIGPYVQAKLKRVPTVKEEQDGFQLIIDNLRKELARQGKDIEEMRESQLRVAVDRAKEKSESNRLIDELTEKCESQQDTIDELQRRLTVISEAIRRGLQAKIIIEQLLPELPEDKRT